jgi:hypothetical protein
MVNNMASYLTTVKEVRECIKNKTELWTILIREDTQEGFVFRVIVDSYNRLSGKSICVDKWIPKYNKILCLVCPVVETFRSFIWCTGGYDRPMNYLFYDRESAILALNKYWKQADIEEDRV